MDKKEEYIDFLKSFKNKELNEQISDYRNNLIEFDELEYYAIDNMYLSMNNYFKTFKIGRILGNS